MLVLGKNYKNDIFQASNTLHLPTFLLISMRFYKFQNVSKMFSLKALEEVVRICRFVLFVVKF